MNECASQLENPQKLRLYSSAAYYLIWWYIYIGNLDAHLRTRRPWPMRRSRSPTYSFAAFVSNWCHYTCLFSARVVVASIITKFSSHKWLGAPFPATVVDLWLVYNVFATEIASIPTQTNDNSCGIESHAVFWF